MSDTRRSRERHRARYFAKPKRPVVDLRYLAAGAKRLPPPVSQSGAADGQ